MGYTVYQNLILSLDAILNGVYNPEEFVILYDPSNNSVFKIFQELIGIGLTKYVMPYNAFIGLTVGLNYFKIERTGLFESEYLSRTGFGFVLRAGKEFWISKNWGIGISGFYNFGKSTLEMRTTEGPFINNSFGVLVSATYH